MEKNIIVATKCTHPLHPYHGWQAEHRKRENAGGPSIICIYPVSLNPKDVFWCVGCKRKNAARTSQIQKWPWRTWIRYRQVIGHRFLSLKAQSEYAATMTKESWKWCSGGTHYVPSEDWVPNTTCIKHACRRCYTLFVQWQAYVRRHEQAATKRKLNNEVAIMRETKRQLREEIKTLRAAVGEFYGDGIS